ncbi:anthranilate phosphoribosyltransferase [Virgibacillus phasianinus]|uniref:Anthranilate phosphoribosyltransferase n=1 Tax=Virgibacillus phasianinus TaxID=2017483 RepID=A0A220U0H8_9BACI|nr:anthranilate phosphoribosyltransferase [Virgibacillus phasianinus]ASK61456.1 anthranilate phosphoribosyltransferase [Virgibacillus phasianinus]
MKQQLEKLMNQKDLSIEEMKQATEHCFTQDITDTEIASLLTALRAKGETADEIAGIVEVIRAESQSIPTSLPHVMDNCGTGGDQSHSFNISTTAAFVIAGAGVTIAKHGNRSISSKTGSADVLEHLGVSLSFQPEKTDEILRENGIAFLYAPHVHPNLKRFMKVRKELGLPTILNLIGPLTNPVALDSQLLGIYRRDMLAMMAESLNKLGRRRALVVNGAGYMDEASLAGDNHLVLLENGKTSPFTIHPEELGLPVHSNEHIRGGDAKDNAVILQNVLQGKQGPYLDTVLLNAGLGLFANGTAATINEGVKFAKESIASGAALDKLKRLMEYSKQIPTEVL